MPTESVPDSEQARSSGGRRPEYLVPSLSHLVMPGQRQSLPLLFLIAVYTVVVFLLDLSVPLGVAVTYLYVLSVLPSGWLPWPKASMATAGACTALILIGAPLSPGSVLVESWSVLLNRGFSITMIWIVAMAVFHRRRSEDTLESVMQSSPVGMILVDSGGTIRFANWQAEAMFGSEAGGLLAEPIARLLPEFITAPSSRPMGQGQELIAKRKAGEEFPVEVALSRVKTPGGKMTIASIADISERKERAIALHARARQQATIADLGQFALKPSDLQEVMNQTVARLAETLDVDYVKVLELVRESEFLLRAGVGWREGLVGHATVGADLTSQAGYTLSCRHPVIVEDLRQESRFSGSPLLFDHGVVSGLSCAIAGPAGRPYGVLGCHTTIQRRFTEDDVHFLEAAANVLGQTIQRLRAEEERQANVTLLAVAQQQQALRATQQAGIADLGKAALQTRELQSLMDLAVREVAKTLDVACSKIVELLPDRGIFLLKAGVGWREGLVGKATFGISPRDSQAGYTLAKMKPMIAEDLQAESRFRVAPFIHDHGVRCALNCPIVGADGKPYGVLEADSTERRSFSKDDLIYLQGIAQVVAFAIDRFRAEEAVRHYVLMLKTSNEPIFLWDLESGIFEWNQGCERLYGFTKAEAIGRASHVLLQTKHPESSDEFMTRLLEQGEREAELRQTMKDGRVCIVHSRQQVIALGGRTVVVEANRDITARKLAEEALSSSEERYRSLVSVLTDVPWVTDPAGAFVEPQPAWEAYTGQPWDTHRGFGWVDALHPDDREHVKTIWSRACERSTRYESGGRLWHAPTQQWRHFMTKAIPLVNADGSVREWVGTATDIHELKLAEDALRESEAFNRSVFESSGDCIKVLDLDTRILAMNAPGLRIMEIDEFDSVRDQDYLLFWQGEAAASARLAVETARAGGAGRFQGLCPTMKGTLKWWDVIVTPIRGADGTVVRLAAVSRDITQIKEIEASLREREEQLRIITDAVPSLISYVDSEERYRFVNGLYEDLYGLPRDEIIGKTISQLMGPDYGKAKPYIDRAMSGEPVRFEADMVHAGKPVTVLTSYTPNVRREGSVDGFYVLATDITERKWAEDELRRLKDQLELGVEERTKALIVSQERLRAMAAELTVTEQRERRRLATELHDYLAQLLVVSRMKLSQAERLVGSTSHATLFRDIDQVLDQSLTYTRSLVAELSPQVLYQFGLPQALHWLGEQMRQHGLLVAVEAETDSLPLSEEQAVLLYQSVRELLLNVVKHAETDRASLVLMAQSDGEMRIEVSDQGRGFEPATTATNVESPHFGHFSIRERMEALKGRLEIRSAPGRGTTVTLVMPMAPQKARPAGTTRRGAADGTHIQAEYAPRDKEGKLRLLLVEDHTMVREGLRTSLGGRPGLEIIGEASNGAEAVNLAQTLHPDVIIMDVNMPGMDGIEAARRITAKFPAMRIIGLSVNADEFTKSAMLKAGASVFLSKHAESEELCRAIDAVIMNATGKGAPERGGPVPRSSEPSSRKT